MADHPDAVVLDLGAGLNDRMFRIAPPPTVDWYDVDFPEVIALRRSVLREHAQAHTIGASLTDPHWLDQIPPDTGRGSHPRPSPRGCPVPARPANDDSPGRSQQNIFTEGQDPPPPLLICYAFPDGEFCAVCSSNH